MSVPRHLGVHLLSLAVAVAIAVALLEPVPVVLEAASHELTFPLDKLAHFGFFLLAAVPWRRSLAVLGVKSPGIAVVVTAALYGGLLEVAQGLWTARDAEVADMVAGALGALAGSGIVRAVRAARRPGDARQGRR